MSLLQKLVRPELRNVAPYSSARTEAEGQAAIALDANENPWPPFGPWGAACRANRYPDPQPAALVQRIASLWGVSADSILLGRGSDEGIDLLIRLFCRPGVDHILVCPPTFSMYAFYAEVQGAGVTEVPLRVGDGQLDLPMILEACSPATKLIFIPAPNAPVGHKMREEDLLTLADARRDQSLIVVDEAYVAFSDKPEGLIPALAEHPNLVILRTFSKAQGLAGERLGMVLANPEITVALGRIQSPYPLTQSSIRIACDALSPAGVLDTDTRIDLLRSERERLRKALASASGVMRVYPSVTNFLFVETDGATAFMQKLERAGIRIRSRDSVLQNCVRISVGSPDENDLLLRALGVEVSSAPTRRFASLRRATNETKIDVVVDLDHPVWQQVETGIGFFDHMIAQIAQHGGFGLALMCKGDLQTGQHHTIEDCALGLGEALRQALGDRKGIGRYGFTTPLDEALADVVIDLSGRPYTHLQGAFPKGFVGDMEAEMVPHFFQSFAAALGAAIHVTVRGENSHHCVEACFKALGRALRAALHLGPGEGVPSTKGVLR